MRFNIIINQQKCIHYGLNSNQGALMDILNQAPSWASERIINGKLFWHVARSKVVQEIPLFYSKEDTVYRAYKFLAVQEMIEYVQQGRMDFVRLTVKGKGWNKVGTKSEKLGTISELGNESAELGNSSEFDLLLNSDENQEIKPKNSDSFPTYNIINTTSNKREEALSFLERNFQSKYEAFLMKFQTRLGADFEAFKIDYNCKVIEEVSAGKLVWEVDALIARGTRMAENWVRNQKTMGRQNSNNGAGANEPGPAYRNNIV